MPKLTPFTNIVSNRTSLTSLDLQNIKEEGVKKYDQLNVTKNSEVKKHSLKIIVCQDLEPDNILKIV